eukprot:GEMP01096015.1.p1 GENE.GEMP01096015.1~~GEMP01096015.1.p1  ORF type:complete len:119 (+),score=9.08 GEMP01096015.1:105-461(+)
MSVLDIYRVPMSIYVYGGISSAFSVLFFRFCMQVGAGWHARVAERKQIEQGSKKYKSSRIAVCIPCFCVGLFGGQLLSSAYLRAFTNIDLFSRFESMMIPFAPPMPQKHGSELGRRFL